MSKVSQLYHQNIFWIQSFLIFATTILLLTQASTIFPLDYCNSFPIGLFLLLSLYVLFSTQQPERPLKNIDQVIPLLETIQWLPITLRIKSELLIMANQEPSWSDCCSLKWLVTPLWSFAISWKCKAPFLPKNPHTRYSVHVERSSYWSVYAHALLSFQISAQMWPQSKKSRYIKMEY